MAIPDINTYDARTVFEECVTSKINHIVQITALPMSAMESETEERNFSGLSDFLSFWKQPNFCLKFSPEGTTVFGTPVWAAE